MSRSRVRSPQPSTSLAVLAVVFASLIATPALRAQSVAEDAEVQAQIRLFSAWIEGQIASRELPGVVVGVVHGDDLKEAGLCRAELLVHITPLEEIGLIEEFAWRLGVQFDRWQSFARDQDLLQRRGRRE